MEDLMKLRESIDEIDSEIVRLYKERMSLSIVPILILIDMNWMIIHMLI